MKRASAPELTSSTEPPVVVGRLGRPHGLRGHLTLVSETDNEERFAPGARLLLPSGDTLVVRSTQMTGNGRIIAFEGVADRNKAEKLRGSLLMIPAGERRQLRPGEFWPDELVGLEVRDQQGQALGTVKGVDDLAPQTRLSIATKGGERMIPLVPDLVPVISIAEGFLVVTDLPGLLDDDVS
ncbi:MAG TPA: ribosome maturation factor RimM [Acidimicrobiia bacterium]|nr:ribosome maturation factor RimM [Acidimicrobiia bacterium]